MGKTGAFGSLAPAGVVVVETARPVVWEHEPGPDDEQAVLGRGVADARVRDFRVGRACARRALDRLGVPAGPGLPPGPARQPIWPPGVVGSITHCTGYAAAAVARQVDVPGLGIDVECTQALEAGVVRRVCTPAEQAWLAYAPPDGLPWPLLIFSAKESIYKAWYPFTGRWLGFQDVTLRLDPPGRAFEAELPDGLSVSGRFAASSRHVFTLVVLAARATDFNAASAPATLVRTRGPNRT